MTDVGTSASLWETPIVDVVEAWQDLGCEVWIAGFSTDGRYALIIDGDRGSVSVAPVGTVSGLGRWECTKAHHDHHSSIYTERFPLR